MSHIFDALQKKQSERPGIDVRNLAAAELLQISESTLTAERESAVDVGESPADSRTELSSPSRPDKGLRPIQHSSERDTVTLQTPQLNMDEKERDEVMKFVQQMFLMPGAEAPRTVALTGIESGNGCTWICCRAAQVLASQDKSPVCIVDANLRSPGLHQVFGVENHHGLSDALEETQSICNFVRPLGKQNLWLLSCGANPAERSSLLSSNRMPLRLSELRRYFKYVLIDSPALSVANDGIVLGRAAEGVILVLKANSSRREAALQAVQDLQNAGVRILGTVLNQRTFPIPQAIYNRL
jgi:capsular exopolysaccharide synthesis family protein